MTTAEDEPTHPTAAEAEQAVEAMRQRHPVAIWLPPDARIEVLNGETPTTIAAGPRGMSKCILGQTLTTSAPAQTRGASR